jgi:AraC-like DNA-binding protein
MVQDGLNASEASERVGYNSLSQFSREFKRMFGNSPTEEVARTRSIYGMDQKEHEEFVVSR